MTEKNPYHHFREHRLFDQVHQFVQNLDDGIETHYPEVYERWEDDVQVMGTLRDVEQERF